MSAIQMTWGWPAIDEDQRPLAHALIEVSADPAQLGWAEHRVVSATGPGRLRLVDVAPGTHHLRVTTIDVDGRRSDPETVTVTVPSGDAPPAEDPWRGPGRVTDLTAVAVPS